MKETSLDRIAQDMARVTGVYPGDMDLPPYDFDAAHKDNLHRAIMNIASIQGMKDEIEDETCPPDLPPAA